VIVVDSSALCAIFFDEPERGQIQRALNSANRRLLSAVNAHETALVLRGKLGREAVAAFWRWLDENGVEIAAFDAAQARAAAAAFDLCGKGLHPKARLNLADCAAFALARSLNAPLLFKGEDFTATDIERVLA
jgi:ribonuclease VapC